jgi:heme-degrading monooxygenase HmoA
MSYYMSMQSVRFRSGSDYERFKMLWGEVHKHLKSVPGFVSLTWWVHPDDPELFNEISVWEDKASTESWHMNGFHKKLKEWGFSGTIIEDMVVNWESVGSHILRKCPLCGTPKRQPFELREEIKTKQVPCECGFEFPYLASTESNFAFYAESPK